MIEIQSLDKPDSGRIKENFAKVKARADEAAKAAGRDPNEIKIIAVSKTHPPELLLQALDAGVNVFGENYAQEFRDKRPIVEESAPITPEWHYIGKLQRNKVKYLIPYVKMIHTVDSLKLAKEISKRCEQEDIEIDILLQANTSGEESKSGVDPTGALELARQIASVERLNIRGLMTIGSFSPDGEKVLGEFRLLRKIRDEIRDALPDISLDELSMGMTGDYPLAIREGATLIRVGTAIFGPRDYSK